MNSITILNEQQLKAVNKINGPLMILAGAGTGKTKTLTARIVQIIKNNQAKASEIFATTFTNKAAKEMRNRIDAEIGQPEKPWINTFHSIASKILRQNAATIGFTNDFIILDTDYQQKLLKNITNEIAPKLITDEITNKKITLNYILKIIQSWKDCNKTPQQAIQIADDKKNQQIYRIAKIYSVYQERLKKNNSMDFGDLIMKNMELFTNQNILEYYQKKFKYIMIDECQDTNAIQYQWIKLLAMQHNNICCVGDDDQSIYGWRGARVGNMSDFLKDFPNPVLIKLEKNYRSTQNILNIASSIINHNKNRLGKTLWSDTQHTEKAKIIKFHNNVDEAKYIINKIIQTESHNPEKECLILIRSKTQSRIFEDICIKKNVPYQIIGGMRFYDRAEIKDMIAYLQIALNPNNDIALQRIINKPKRGIGETTLTQALSHAIQNKSTVMQSLQNLDQKIKTKIMPTMLKIEKWHKLSKIKNPAELLEIILDDSGYKTLLTSNPEDEDLLEKLSHIEELIRSLYDFDNLNTFLEQVALQSSSDKNIEKTAKIKIMTIHAAKGLEFHSIFLPNWEDGSFPHIKAIDNPIDMEEERRLAYVAITRAKEQLCISYSAFKIKNGFPMELEKSRFINEINQKELDFIDYNKINSQSFNEKQVNTKNINQNSKYQSKSSSIVGKKIDHPEFGKIIILSTKDDIVEILILKSCNIIKIPLNQIKISN